MAFLFFLGDLRKGTKGRDEGRTLTACIVDGQIPIPAVGIFPARRHSLLCGHLGRQFARHVQLHLSWPFRVFFFFLFFCLELLRHYLLSLLSFFFFLRHFRSLFNTQEKSRALGATIGMIVTNDGVKSETSTGSNHWPSSGLLTWCLDCQKRDGDHEK